MECSAGNKHRYASTISRVLGKRNAASRASFRDLHDVELAPEVFPLRSDGFFNNRVKEALNAVA